MSAPPPDAHRTLFVAPAAVEGRGRRAPPGPPGGSDRERPARLAIAAGSSVLGAVAALLAWPPAPPSGPGPLTPPHVAAGLACESCHGEAEPGGDEGRAAARRACAGCHGEHASARAGHRALARRGSLGCPSCHAIHGAQGGVALPEEGPAIRYGTRGAHEVDGVAFHAGRRLLVPVVELSRCLACHTEAGDDPLARCRSGALRAHPSEPSLCFDEHRGALPADEAAATDAPGRAARRTAPRSAVCEEQHQDDRAFAWEAARLAVLASPSPPIGRSGGAGSAPVLGGGVALGLLGWFASGAWQRRRRRTTPPPAPAPTAAPRRRLPTIDTSTCLGCYACVDACPYDVLAVERYVAVVARPEACCGLVLCAQRCPNGSLRVDEGAPAPDRPALGDDLQSRDVPGLFLAGDVTGVPLIKNAILQGARAADGARAYVDALRADDDPSMVDVCVLGAGPAGISAALRLGELGKNAVVLEQGGVAQSIQSFPRGKLVFDQPLELPVHGQLWLERSTKEELLGAWMRIVRRAKLRVEEGHRVVGAVRRPGGGFEVSVESDAGPSRVLARALVVAVGQRGSPRRLDLPIPPEAESQVHYHLADARSFAGKRVVLVGLGDVAMEAAVALSAQPNTSVTIVHRSATYTRGQSRNVAEVERLRRAGRIRLCASRQPTRIHTGSLEIAPVPGADGPTEALPFDHLFVLIGGTRPWALLERLGLPRPSGGAAERPDAAAHSGE